LHRVTRTAVIAAMLMGLSPEAAAMDIDSTFQGITTLVIATTPFGPSSATGFFYQQLGPRDPAKSDPQWRGIEKLWLITNRHAVPPRPNDQETLPGSLAFHMRRKDGGRLRWDPVVLAQEEIVKRARFLPDAGVDVAGDRRFRPDHEQAQRWRRVPPVVQRLQGGLPGQSSDHRECGRRRSRYRLPAFVLRPGEPLPDRQVRYRCLAVGRVVQREAVLPHRRQALSGSSGSIVITKPKSIEIVGGRLAYSKEKQFALLGIFSGEPVIAPQRPVELESMIIVEKLGFNVGTVWYADAIEETVTKGVTYGTQKK